MSFIPFNASQVTAGRADDQYLFDLSKRNFTDHENRVLLLEGGSLSVGTSVASDTNTSGTFKIMASVQITSHARPIFICLCATSAAGGGLIYCENTSAGQAVATSEWKIERKDYVPLYTPGTMIKQSNLSHTNAANGVFKFGIPCSALAIFDYPAAGMFVYTLYGGVGNSANNRCGVENVALCAIELRG